MPLNGTDFSWDGWDGLVDYLANQLRGIKCGLDTFCPVQRMWSLWWHGFKSKSLQFAKDVSIITIIKLSLSKSSKSLSSNIQNHHPKNHRPQNPHHHSDNMDSKTNHCKLQWFFLQLAKGVSIITNGDSPLSNCQCQNHQNHHPQNPHHPNPHHPNPHHPNPHPQNHHNQYPLR